MGLMFTLSTGSMVWVLSNPSISVPIPTIIALRAVSVLMNFVTFHPKTMGNGMIEGISGYDTLVHSHSFVSLASSTNRLNFVCSFHFTCQSQSFSSPVFGRAYGERVLPNPNSLLQFQFTIVRNPTRERGPMNFFTISPQRLQRVSLKTFPIMVIVTIKIMLLLFQGHSSPPHRW